MDFLRSRMPQKHRDRLEAVSHALRESFVEHPHETGETFWQHLRFTTATAGTLLGCGLMILIHGFFPFWFKHGVSDRIHALHDVLAARAARGKAMPGTAPGDRG